MPPASANLSRLSRIQAIRPSERPSIALSADTVTERGIDGRGFRGRVVQWCRHRGGDPSRPAVAGPRPPL